MKLLTKKYIYDVAVLLASLVTIRSEDGTPVLPQGSPSSPAIASLVVEHLDARLSGFAAKHGIHYTRYVDDIIFSCSKNDPWHTYAGYFKKIINTEGFQLNEKKNRVSFYFQRQEVVGLTVNSKLNVTQRYIKQLRTILHNWEKDGYEYASNKCLMHYFKKMVNPKRKMPKMEHIVSGKLSYLKMVRSNKLVKNSDFPKNQGFLLFNSEFDTFEEQLDPNGYTMVKFEDPVWAKLHARYVALLKRDFNIINGYKEGEHLQKLIYRYGDAIGPLVHAVRKNDNESWRIIKIQDKNGQWFDGDEYVAYRMRYGYEPRDF